MAALRHAEPLGPRGEGGGHPRLDLPRRRRVGGQCGAGGTGAGRAASEPGLMEDEWRAG